MFICCPFAPIIRISGVVSDEIPEFLIIVPKFCLGLLGFDAFPPSNTPIPEWDMVKTALVISRLTLRRFNVSVIIKLPSARNVLDDSRAYSAAKINADVSSVIPSPFAPTLLHHNRPSTEISAIQDIFSSIRVF